MALTKGEKVAARLFMVSAQSVLDQAWQDEAQAGREPAADCPWTLAFWRHECEKTQGRTRAVALKEVTLDSPPMMVWWNGTSWEAVTVAEAEKRAEMGVVAEYDMVVGRRFRYTWREGRCGKCGFTARSRRGQLREGIPRPAAREPEPLGRGKM